MIIYYKNETNLTKYTEQSHNTQLYKDGTFLTKIGLKKEFIQIFIFIVVV